MWAFGSGKGGVGKSVIAANLAVLLARRGTRVALLDADLGGANLHTLLGMPNPRRTLADFLARRCATLGEVLNPTPEEGLWLVSGARAMMESANPSFALKEKILRHIARLPVDLVLLDLGAGSSFAVLDFFLAAHSATLVVVPEPTSVENSYQFLRAAFYRCLKRAGRRDVVQPLVKAAAAEGGARSPRVLIERVRELDAEVGEALGQAAQTFTPSVLVNQATEPAHHRLGDDMATACRDYFGVEVTSLGAIERDVLVGRSVLERRPAVDLFPQSAFVETVTAIADRITAAGIADG